MKFCYVYIRWDNQLTWTTERIDFEWAQYKAVIKIKWRDS